MRVVFGAVVVWNLSYVAGFLGLVYVAVKSYFEKDATTLIISGLILFGFILVSLALAMGSYSLTERRADEKAEQ